MRAKGGIVRFWPRYDKGELTAARKNLNHDTDIAFTLNRPILVRTRETMGHLKVNIRRDSTIPPLNLRMLKFARFIFAYL